MEATPKLTLIQQLGVVPVCARWQAGLPSVEVSDKRLHNTMWRGTVAGIDKAPTHGRALPAYCSA